MAIGYETIREAAQKLVETVNYEAGKPLEQALREAYKRETSELARKNLCNILKSIEVSRAEKIPLCQAPGHAPLFFVEVGEGVKVDYRLVDALKEAVRGATQRGFLRPSIVDAVTRENTGDNTARYYPAVHVDLVSGRDWVDLYVVHKAGPAPIKGIYFEDMGPNMEAVVEYVLQNVVSIGAYLCPPLFLTVAIGGMSDMCMRESARALLRPIGSRNPNPKLAKLEERILEAVNQLGIGAGGMGGDVTALDVWVEADGTYLYIAGVANHLQCWPIRRGRARIYRDESFEIEVY